MRRSDAADASELQAYHDGEIGWLARHRIERRLARDEAARAELRRLADLGAALRALDAEAGSPDLWAGVRAGLPASIPARPSWAEQARLALFGAPAAWAAGAAALVLALGLWAGLLAGPTVPEAGSVRWLDGRGRPLMVLRDDAEATIIWLPGAAETSGRRGGRSAGLGLG